MKNINLLFEKNCTSLVKIKPRKRGVIVIEDKSGLITGKTINEIIKKINALHKQYGKIKFSIEFHFGKTTFIDKLTFVIFECICYDLICNYGHYVQVYMEVDVSNDIYIAGINSSPLLLLNNTTKETVKKYEAKFKYDIYKSHFRRVIDGEHLEETNFLGRVYEDINTFLKLFEVEEQSRDEVANVITELVGNACEHGKSDCLIDIDVATNYTKVVENDSDGNIYYGINIAVVNISDVLLGDGIYQIISSQRERSNERYDTVIKAYKNHQKMFSEDYSLDDFCNITTFQHKISGRDDFSNTGGKGLTKLIRSLEEESDTYKCYVISGRRALYFYKELLEYNEDWWIGFNKKKDYISSKPGATAEGENVIASALIYMPGTAYNLNFVMRGKKKND